MFSRVRLYTAEFNFTQPHHDSVESLLAKVDVHEHREPLVSPVDGLREEPVWRPLLVKFTLGVKGTHRRALDAVRLFPLDRVQRLGRVHGVALRQLPANLGATARQRLRLIVVQARGGDEHRIAESSIPFVRLFATVRS